MHRMEIKAGEDILHGTITPYLCWSNHVFLVRGPHVLCKCNGARHAVLLQKPEEHCGCGQRGYHHHSDGTSGTLRQDVVRVFCYCGIGVKDAKTCKKAEREAAATAYLIGGYYAALQVFTFQTVNYPPHKSSTYDSLLPDNFPAGR